MKKSITFLLLFSFFIFVPSSFADEGMWTYDNPPLKQWKERYGFEPSKDWMDNMRLASIKIGGGSASFVSPNGLIVTNHHVASGIISRLSTKEKDYLKNGFYAPTLADELKGEAEARVLVSYEDVTSRIHGSVKSGATAAEASEQRSAEINAIEKEESAKTGLRCTVVSMYSGGEYWLYRFKVYDDIRLVAAPEEQAAFFGGDYDNFVFPRHDLDYTFLRAYENDKPAVTPHYFKWSQTGPTDGEFVVASGSPGATARLLTVSQLKYARDYGNPLLKASWETRRNALIAYGKLGEDQQREAAGGIRGLANSLKRLEGQENGLLNPKMFATKEAEEKDLRDKLKAKPEMNAKYASAWTDIEKAYTELPKHSAMLNFGTINVARLGSFASAIVRYHDQMELPEAERFPEYRADRIESFRTSFVSDQKFSKQMDEVMLTRWLKEAVKLMGRDHPFIKAALGDAEAEEVAARAVRETRLDSIEFRRGLLAADAKSIEKVTDPMVALARRIEPMIRETRTWNELNVRDVEETAGIKIAQARFAVYGKTMPPDANSNPRISFGKVAGYEEDTTLVPFKTTFFGLYDRALSFDDMMPFQLSAKLKERRDKIDLSVPINFVYTADTIGGNSGSPVINRKAELVGLNFDSNNQKLSNKYWYVPDDEGSRAVAVHSAGILEALRKVYDANRVVEELLEAAK
jgi:hypothetical protein